MNADDLVNDHQSEDCILIRQAEADQHLAARLGELGWLPDSGDSDNFANTLVPKGHYLFMGDNRDCSNDSRDTKRAGLVPEENIIGLVELVIWNDAPPRLMMHRITP